MTLEVKNPSEEQFKAMQEFGEHLGKAFQLLNKYGMNYKAIRSVNHLEDAASSFNEFIMSGAVLTPVPEVAPEDATAPVEGELVSSAVN